MLAILDCEENKIQVFFLSSGSVLKVKHELPCTNLLKNSKILKNSDILSAFSQAFVTCHLFISSLLSGILAEQAFSVLQHLVFGHAILHNYFFQFEDDSLVATRVSFAHVFGASNDQLHMPIFINTLKV